MQLNYRTGLCALLAALLLTGCSEEIADSASQTETTTTKTTTTTEVTTTTAPEVTEIYNPLTGEAGYSESAVGQRPVAVMVNNLKAALPQYGVAQADILYEIPVEGGITRLLAVYADAAAMPDICSVRSCRYYYALLAHSMDAIYCHWGSDQTIAMDTLNRLKLDRMDGGGSANGVIYFRDSDRVKKYASEHTGYLKGSAVPDAIDTYGFRTEWNYDSLFLFHQPDEPQQPAGDSCTQINLPFSESYYSTFTYDTETATYLKQHSGKPHMDSRADKQLAFTNLLVLQTPVHTRADGYLMDVGLDGGKGYYVSGGAAQEIVWKKPSEDAKIALYDTSGKELTINAGKTYIGLIGDNRKITIE